MRISSLLKRRSFLFGGISALLSYPLLRLSKGAVTNLITPDTIPLKVGAAQMRPRANALKLDFITTHLRPASRVPVPFAKIFHGASMLPTDLNKAEKLLSRQDLKWQGDHLISTARDKLTAPFRATLCGVVIKLFVTFPKIIDVTVSFQNDTLLFTFNQIKDQPILFSILSALPECEGVAITIGDQQILSSLAISPTAVVITMSDKRNLNNRFELTLDLMSAAQNPVRAASSLFTALLKRMSLVMILFVCLLTAGSQMGCCRDDDVCCKDRTAPGCEGHNPGTEKCPITRQRFCLPPSGQPDAGFFIVDFTYVTGSPCGEPGSIFIPNSWTEECYDNKEKDCTMTICATAQPMPAGWTIIERKRSLGVCSAGNPSGDNVFVVKRLNNKPAVPRCGSAAAKSKS